MSDNEDDPAGTKEPIITFPQIGVIVLSAAIGAILMGVILVLTL